jgi:hypothetical protein
MAVAPVFECIHTYIHTYTGHTKTNGAVSEVNKNVFLILRGHNLHCQQQKLSKFLMRYQ